MKTLNSIFTILFFVGAFLSACLENNFEWYSWLVMILTLVFGLVALGSKMVILENESENDN